MLKSKIAPIIVGIVMLIAAASWIWVVNSIDYTKMRAREGNATSSAPAQTP